MYTHPIDIYCPQIRGGVRGRRLKDGEGERGQPWDKEIEGRDYAQRVMPMPAYYGKFESSFVYSFVATLTLSG